MRSVYQLNRHPLAISVHVFIPSSIPALGFRFPRLLRLINARCLTVRPVSGGLHGFAEKRRLGRSEEDVYRWYRCRHERVGHLNLGQNFIVDVGEEELIAAEGAVEEEQSCNGNANDAWSSQ